MLARTSIPTDFACADVCVEGIAVALFASNRATASNDGRIVTNEPPGFRTCEISRSMTGVSLGLRGRIELTREHHVACVIEFRQVAHVEASELNVLVA